MFCAESLGKDNNCYFLSWRKVTYVALGYCGVENSPQNTTKKKGLLKFIIIGLLDCLIASSKEAI